MCRTPNPVFPSGDCSHAVCASTSTNVGEVPSLVLLGNHGIVAISQSVEGADAISAMAVKSARVRLGALQAGGIRGLGEDATRHYFARPDFVDRRAALSATAEAAQLQEGTAS